MGREGGGLDPYHLHTLRQWQGPYWDGLDDDPKPLPTPESTGLPQERVDEMQGIYRPEPLEYTGPSGLADLGPYPTNELDTSTLAQGDVLDFGDDQGFLDDMRQRLGNF